MTPQCVQVKLDLGHRATIRKKETAEGFTHDWVVFVRGAEGSKIEEFVEKVVFNLHDSFPKPRRSLKSPPYQLSESGYAGFLMCIDIYFKSREDPKKVTFEYDLFLQIDGPPVSNVRCEKLTFTNPSEEFKERLLTAGAVIVESPESFNPVHVPVEPKSSPISSTLPDLSPPPMNSCNGIPSSGGSIENSHPQPSDIKRKSKSSVNGDSSKKMKLMNGKHKSHSSSGKYLSQNGKGDSTSATESNHSKGEQNVSKFKSSSSKPSPKSSKKPKDEISKKFHISSFVKSPHDKDNIRSVSSSTQKENKAHREKVGFKSVSSSIPVTSHTPEKANHKKTSDSKSSGKTSSSSEKHKKKSSHHDKHDDKKKKISEFSVEKKCHSIESSSHSHKKKHHKHKHHDTESDKTHPNELKSSPPYMEKVLPNLCDYSSNQKVKTSNSVSSSPDESKNCAINPESGNESDSSCITGFASNHPWERIEKMVKILNESTHSEFLCEVVECVLDSAQKYDKTSTRFEVELGQMDQNCMDKIIEIFKKYSHAI